MHQLTIAMEKKLLQPAATAAFAIAAGRGAVSCCSTAEEFDEFKNNEHSRLLQYTAAADIYREKLLMCVLSP